MISVLYVDDEEMLLDIGKLFLERPGDCSVDTAVSAKNMPLSGKVTDFCGPGPRRVIK